MKRDVRAASMARLCLYLLERPNEDAMLGECATELLFVVGRCRVKDEIEQLCHVAQNDRHEAVSVRILLLRCRLDANLNGVRLLNRFLDQAEQRMCVCDLHVVQDVRVLGVIESRDLDNEAVVAHLERGIEGWRGGVGCEER